MDLSNPGQQRTFSLHEVPSHQDRLGKPHEPGKRELGLKFQKLEADF